MVNLINEFYNSQNTIVNQMNTHHAFFINKRVDIIIQSQHSNKQIYGVYFKGYSIKQGFIHLNWKKTKLDGTESKQGDSIIILKNNSINIILNLNHIL